MAQPSTSEINISNCNINVFKAGKGSRILFLHGGGGAGAWSPFFDKLSDKYEVIVPEHPGFGRSNSPEWLDNVADLANFYLDFIKTLGLNAIHLVGHSLGGWIAADLATRNTSVLRTLTLISSAGIHVTGVSKGDLFLWNPEERVRNLFHDQSLASQVLAEPINDEQRNATMKNAMTLARLAWSPRLYDRNLRKWLHRIDVPTLILWGRDDKLIPAAYGAAYRDLIPGARLQTLEGCGHLPHVERSSETLAAAVAFIEGAK
jgi:pimeloyl-ACP methyl ester carboxylesterase